MAMTHGQYSQDLAARARARIPGGVNSNVRLANADRFFARGAGPWLWDVDGNAYIDYALGMGPTIFGHANPAIDAAVSLACADGMVFAGQNALEVHAAERLCELLRWPDRVRLGMTGTEMVQVALRLARAATGKQRFVRFAGHYHGWVDNVLLAPGEGRVPGSSGQALGSLDKMVLVRWNDAEALERELDAQGDQIAAVIMEPVMLNTGAAEPLPGYLERVREACTRHGVVLVFDEVITGFRVALGGAAERYGVTPDLATYGKALAGGWPVAAIAGRAEIMDLLADGTVNHSGTFNGSVMASAATIATLALLEADPPYARMDSYGSRLMAGLREAAERHDLALNVDGVPAAFAATLVELPGTAEADLPALLADVLADAGIWTTSRGLWFVSAVHRDAELEETLSRIDDAFERLGSQPLPAV
jgi:glutamate-1-semialdehyde 2,1-aminomutase